MTAPSGYLPDTRWTLTDVVLAIVAGAMASLVIVAILDPSGTGGLTVIETEVVLGAQSAGSLAVLWLLSVRRGTGDWTIDFGFTLRVGDLWGVAAGAGLQIVVALVTAPFIYWLFPEGPPAQGVGETAQSAESVLEILLIVVLFVVVAPVVEEIIFRGMLLSRLSRGPVEGRTQLWLWLVGALLTALSIPLGRNLTEGAVVLALWSLVSWSLFWIGLRRPVVWAVGNAAATFAVIHLLDPNTIALLPGLFIIGVVLGIAAVRRGDLSLAIPLHAGVNLLGALVFIFGDELAGWAERELNQVEGLIRLFF